MSEYEMLTIQQANKSFNLSVIVAIISFLSLAAVYYDYRHRKNKERAEKSVDIAKVFAQKIITPLSFLYAFFEKNEIDKIIKKVHFLKFEDFDIDELKSNYLSDDIQNYLKQMNNNDPENKIRSIITDTLNILEYLSMYINTKVADEKYIYNSLHQQFLQSIWLLYFEISLVNTDNKDKYYTNIIQLYNVWKKKYIKAIKKEDKFKQKQKKMKKKLLLPNPNI